MNRRSVIRNFVVISAGVAVFPYCRQEGEKVSIALKKIKINASQEKLLSVLTETIIPTTDTPGAKEVSSHLFALTMVDDCATAGEQKEFLDGMQQFEELTRRRFGKSFVQCTPSEREQLLSEIQQKDSVTEGVTSFYEAIKSLTLQSYLTSEYYMTNVQKYEMAPGRYHGCVPIKKIS